MPVMIYCLCRIKVTLTSRDMVSTVRSRPSKGRLDSAYLIKSIHPGDRAVASGSGIWRVLNRAGYAIHESQESPRLPRMQSFLGTGIVVVGRVR